MAINKKLLHFVSKANFSTQLANSNIDSKSIVFIKDTGEIWTHDKLYSCASWGTNQTNYVPLTISGTTFNISRDGHTHPFNSLTNIPTTLAGYGITDAIKNNGLTESYIPRYTSSGFVNSKIVEIGDSIVLGGGTGITAMDKSVIIERANSNLSRLVVHNASNTDTDSHSILLFTTRYLSGTQNFLSGRIAADKSTDTTNPQGLSILGSPNLYLSGGFVNVSAMNVEKININATNILVKAPIVSTYGITAPTFTGALSGNASSATALTSNAGSNTNPIYFSSGKPTASTYSFGNASGNIPISNGTLNTNLNADLLDGLHSIKYLPYGCYHNTLGILVTTEVPATSNAMFVIKIIGNDYSSNRGIDTTIQFYNYNDGNSILSYGATNNSFSFGNIRIFNYNGKVCFWFQQANTYQTYKIFAYTNTTPNYNVVESITNAAMPTTGVTREVTITPKQSALITDNVASATKLRYTRTIWGQNFDGTGNVSGNIYGAGSLYTSGYLYSNKSGTDRTVIDYGDSGSAPIFGYGTAGAGFNTYLDGNNIYLRTSSGHSINMMLTSSGNVLIGTTTDSGYKLDVNGTLRATGVIGASAIQTSNTDAYSLILRNSAAAALYVQNTTASGTIASFRYGSVTANGGTSVLDINSGSVVSSVGYSKSGSSDLYVLLGGGGHKAVSTFTPSLVTSTTSTGTTNVATTNTNTYLNIVQGGASTGSSTQVTGTGSVTISSDTSGKLTIYGNNNYLPLTGGALTGNLMVKGTNGISSSSSIHLGIGDSDTGFKWISDGIVQMYANNIAIGQWNSDGMNWYKLPKVNGVNVSLSNHSHSYLPLSGGTLTGNLTAPNYLRSDGATVWHSGNDGSGSGLDADLLDGLQKTSFAQEYNYSTTAQNTGWYKIKILSTSSWMLCFTIRVYQNYEYYDIVVSGYQYGSSYWHAPKARLITGSPNYVDVKFGHDSVNNLWVAIPASYYTGLKICNITNGYQQVSDWSTKFSITNEATLTGTVDSTITAKRPLVYDENAVSATKLGTATIGSTVRPFYLNAGTPTAFSTTVGSSTVPVYMNAGTITACGTSLGVSITGNAATATKSNYQIATGASASDWVANFQATPTHSTSFREMSAGGPSGTWWFMQNFRHSNSNGYWGRQIAWGWEDNAHEMYSRNITGGTFSGWVRFLNSSNYNSFSPTLTGGNASGTWGINVTGAANRLYQGGTTSGSAMVFNWNGQGGQPTWLWGGTDGTNMYVYNPSNFNVASAAYLRNAGTGMLNVPNTGQIRYDYHILPTAGLFPSSNNANSILSINRHTGSYDSQLGFSSDGNIYYRSFTNVALNTTQAWKTLLDSANYNTYAPTKTGTGASGTWGISITGNAGSVDGQNFTYSNSSNSPTYLWATDSNGSSYLAARGSISVNYANSAGTSTTATTATYLPTKYNGGVQSNPQVYFGQSTGLRVAMTGVAGSWSDTLWINGYSGGDVLNMCALHTSRQGTPRIWVSTQECTSTTYGTMYELLSSYNYNNFSPTKTGTGASGTWGISISGNAATATKVNASVAGANSIELVRAVMADNDYFRILVGGTASNSGFAEIATGDDGTEPIYVRQYSGAFTSIIRTATLLNESGNTIFPGAVTGSRFCAGYDSGVVNTINCSGWFRSSGTSGWLSATYGGGIYMEDSTYVRVYGSKAFKVTSTAADSINTDGGIKASGNITTSSKFINTNYSGDNILLAGGETCSRGDVLPYKWGNLTVVNSSYITQSSAKAYQLGHIVILQGTFTTGGSASNGAAYFTIPSSIGAPFDSTGWNGAAGNQNTGIRMNIPAGSRTIYLTWNDTGTNTTYQMSWVYYCSYSA